MMTNDFVAFVIAKWGDMSTDFDRFHSAWFKNNRSTYLMSMSSYNIHVLGDS